ncbi:MAG: dephospho-CoA kinase [Buchnera aphidicola (Nurudea yanoniella)]
MTYIVALTGGICSGKTTVSNFFKKFGVKIIDADIITREVLNHNQTIINAIIKRCGIKCLNINKSINRKYLKNYIFSNKKNKLWLEQLLHPIIIKKMQEKIKDIKSSWCLLVVPLLIEMKLYKHVDRILLVDTPIQQQFFRIIKRDKIKKKQIKSIIMSQATRLKRLSLAHDIINNNSKISSLKIFVEELNNNYLKIAANHSKIFKNL